MLNCRSARLTELSMMMDSRVRLSLVVGAVAGIGFLWLTDVPLGIPGEWTWNRIRFDDDRLVECLWGCGIACAGAAVYIGLAWMGGNRIGVCSRVERAAWLAGLVVAAFGWLWIVQSVPPKEFRTLKPLWVLYDPGASGYFFEACHEMDDVGSFLATYEERMAQGDVLHVGTHPPGLFLLHHGLVSVCRASTGLSRFVLETQPNSVRKSFAAIEQSVRLTPAPLSRPEQAGLWLAVLLTQFIAAATVVPLYGLLRRDYSRQTSWMCTTFWPLVPALAVFLPKSDALYPCLGMLFLWAWLEGWRRGSALLSLSAGLLLWAGMFCSLALLPVLLLAAILTLWEVRSRLNAVWGRLSCLPGPIGRLESLPHGCSVGQAFLPARADRQAGKPAPRMRKLAVAIGCGGAGFLLPVGLLWVVDDLNLFAVWSWNYHNHAAFYGKVEFQRTYWKWLLVNPLELALSAGLPLVVLTAASSAHAAGRTNGWKQQHLGPYWACAVVWGLLWLSGKNMGEAARLWLVLVPSLVWLTGVCIASDRLGGTKPSERSVGQAFLPARADRQAGKPAPRMRRTRLTGWLLALACEAIVCMATVARVDGFHLD